MNPKLTERDIAVLMDIYRYRYLSRSQIEKLHFPSDRTCRRRLQALLELGYIKDFTVPNVPERIFYVDKKGVQALSVEVGIEDLRWSRKTKEPKDYFFLKHFLAINDFRILISHACQQSDMTLIDFIPDYIGEQTEEGHVKKYIRDRVKEYSHTPDAVFVLEKNDKGALFFLEIDRGGEVVSDPARGLLKAVIFYLNYWTSKTWKRYENDFGHEFETFRVLIVTTSKQRIQNLRESTSNYSLSDSYAKRFLWATTNEQATQDWIFEGIWRSLDITDNTLYRIG